MKSIKDLTYYQFDALKVRFFSNKYHRQPSDWEMASLDDIISDQTVYDEYKNNLFDEDGLLIGVKNEKISDSY